MQNMQNRFDRHTKDTIPSFDILMMTFTIMTFRIQSKAKMDTTERHENVKN